MPLGRTAGNSSSGSTEMDRLRAAIALIVTSLVAALLFVAPASKAQFNGGAPGVPNGPGYSAGAWIPTLSTDATPGVPAYSTQSGKFEINGRLATVRYTVAISAWNGSPSGNVTMSLPFPAVGTAADFGDCVITYYTGISLASLSYGITGAIASGSQFVALVSHSATSAPNVPVSGFGNSFLIGFCSYQIS